MARAKVFRDVGSLHPGRSAFDLSYEKLLTCDMGQLIPVMCDEVVPGDIIKLGCQALVRLQPLVAPFYHEVNLYVHSFFVPYRILWDSWETYITGGPNGTDATPIPTWIPSSAGVTDISTLWDYLGFPTNVDPQGAYPIDFPRRAYNKIWNEYYRDQNFMAEVAETNEEVLLRSWEKDYLTSALPWQQRGVAPALPIAGTTSAVWEDSSWTQSGPGTALGFNDAAPGDPEAYVNGANALANAKAWFASNVVDLSVASTFDISDLRLAFQIQKWMERNARAGVRYTEFLGSHFGVAPADDRLSRPEYIGGTKSPIIVSEVLQTSETDTTPQGNLAGHGLSVNNGFIGNYRVVEYGLIMSIMSVMPKPVYQQGINRQWLRRTRYDFYFPEFSNLSEQQIMRAEVYATAVAADNQALFGYQGQYDEMRVKQNMVCGQFRTVFDYWHMSRQFPGPACPVLNEDFMYCVPRKDIFAVPSDPGLLVRFANIIKAIRPMQAIANPGLIDHN